MAANDDRNKKNINGLLIEALEIKKKIKSKINLESRYTGIPFW